MISIVLSTDAGGFGNNATLLGSILRRTSAQVRVRVYTRGFSATSFRSGPLSVEFIRCDEAVNGSYPRHVNEAVFDRLRIIRDFSDWDRVLVMDHDMIALCDLAEYFQVDFGGALLAGRLFGPGNTLGRQMSQVGGLPSGWEHCADYPYFYMAPMMNLAAMREEGIWERLLEAHAAIGRDEQISLTAAAGGRIKEVDKKWNLVPQWDELEALSARVPAAGIARETSIRWVNGVPEGIIHWTDWIKPWHYQSKAWRPELWEAEKTSWAQLRLGLWDKPRAVEIEPDGSASVHALVRRGWKVDALSGFAGPGIDHAGGASGMPHPDLNWHPEKPGMLAALLGSKAPDLIRFGPGAAPSRNLAGLEVLPDAIAIQGPRDVDEMTRLRELGFVAEARIVRGSWPAGGPHPKVLSYRMHPCAATVDFDEDVYLRRDPSAPPVETETDRVLSPVEVEPAFDIFLLERLPGWLPEPGGILVLGAGPAVGRLAGIYPQAAITVIEHDRERVAEWRARTSSMPGVRVLRMPFDSAIPWYDIDDFEIPRFDLLVVSAPAADFSPATRPASASLFRSLRSGGLVLVEQGDAPDGRDCAERWEALGLEVVEDGEGGIIALRADFDPADKPFCAAFPGGRSLREVAERVYVISLPERSDRRSLLARNWEPMGLAYEIADGIRVESADVRWEEMKGMEAYGRVANLRNAYVPAAVGSKRAVIRTLRNFLDSGASTALICLDDCLWRTGAPERISRALAELPADWELLYFSTSARPGHLPFSPRLVRLLGSRVCLAVLWRRETALRLLPELETCDCEWDLFMQRSQGDLNAYAVVPVPACQAQTRSNIAGLVNPAAE